MKTQLVFGFVTATSIPGALANGIGVAVNGRREAGTCPAVALPLTPQMERRGRKPRTQEKKRDDKRKRTCHRSAVMAGCCCT